MAARRSEDCPYHDTHEYRINENKASIDVAAKERIALRCKDKELEQTLNKWKWIGVGIATCFTAFCSLTSAALAAIWWVLSNQPVIKAVIDAKGGI